MKSLTDQQLLTEYERSRAEAAFAELVRRHIGWVYSAAVRIVVDRQLAEDVTQRVFLALAREARPLARRGVLGGWLHRTTHNFAVMTVRTEERRRAREQKTMLPTHPERETSSIVQHLDDAIAQLSEGDRDAITLRYFEQKTANEISSVLGISAQAAQKRITRAVVRLRAQLARYGATGSAAAVAGALTSQIVEAVPPGLCGLVTARALGEAAMVGPASALWLPSFKWVAVLWMKPLGAGAVAVTVLSLSAGGFAMGRVTADEHARAVNWQHAVLSSPAPTAAMSAKRPAVIDEAAESVLPENVSEVLAQAAQFFRAQKADPYYAWAKGFTTMERLLPEQGREALRELDSYRDEPAVFNDLAPLVMAIWAQTEPRAALDHALVSYKGYALGLSIEFVSKAWAQMEPAAAWAWFRETADAGKIPISEGSWMWVPSFIMSEWAATDAPGAFAAFQGMPHAEQRNAMFGIAEAALDATARPAILARMAGLRDESTRAALSARVASSWARLNPPAAAHWVGGLTFENPSAHLKVLGQVAKEWWRSDPHATAQWLLTNSPPEILDEVQAGIRKMSNRSSRP